MAPTPILMALMGHQMAYGTPRTPTEPAVQMYYSTTNATLYGSTSNKSPFLQSAAYAFVF